jgi:hypothetical protein
MGTPFAGNLMVYPVYRMAPLTRVVIPSVKNRWNRYSVVIERVRNKTFTVRYALPEAAGVSIKLYDMQGRLIKALGNSFEQAGRYRVSFNTSGLSTGEYLLDFTADKQSVRKRFVVF